MAERRFDNNQNDEDIHYEEIDHTELEIVQVKWIKKNLSQEEKNHFFCFICS